MGRFWPTGRNWRAGELRAVARVRGKKTVAKEKLYKAIYAQIAALRPRFNIGVSTGLADKTHGRWTEPYRHWKFVPDGANWDRSLTKPRK